MNTDIINKNILSGGKGHKALDAEFNIRQHPAVGIKTDNGDEISTARAERVLLACGNTAGRQRCRHVAGKLLEDHGDPSTAQRR